MSTGHCKRCGKSWTWHGSRTSHCANERWLHFRAVNSLNEAIAEIGPITLHNADWLRPVVDLFESVEAGYPRIVSHDRYKPSWDSIDLSSSDGHVALHLQGFLDHPETVLLGEPFGKSDDFTYPMVSIGMLCHETMEGGTLFDAHLRRLPDGQVACRRFEDMIFHGAPPRLVDGSWRGPKITEETFA